MNTMNNKRQTILITGGRSLLGRRLTEYLRGRGYRILWLTRDVSGGMDMCDETFYWDIEQNVVAEHPLKEADIVIHLAGASLYSERWSSARKKELMRSRLRSARVLTNALAKVENHVHTIIYASSFAYYENRIAEEVVHEDEEPGVSFLSQVFKGLEHEAVVAEQKLGVRTVIMRSSFILDPYAGILPNLIRPVRFGLNVPLGSGKQYVNWVHQLDVCRAYEHVISQEDIRGAFNVAAPVQTTNSQLMYALAAIYGKEHIRVPLPAALVRLAMGEMSHELLHSRPVSTDKLLATGFRYQYDELNKALRASSLE
ncbi:MAG: TIGR01777 family oxidoreductase [Porphyromonas sp.]|nr:TIGR01777 family oxidoreductase [Porphyromonas sp.]